MFSSDLSLGTLVLGGNYSDYKKTKVERSLLKWIKSPRELGFGEDVRVLDGAIYSGAADIPENRSTINAGGRLRVDSSHSC